MVVRGIGRERKVNERCNRRSQRCTQERYRGKGTGKNAAGGAVGCSAEAKADGGTDGGPAVSGDALNIQAGTAGRSGFWVGWLAKPAGAAVGSAGGAADGPAVGSGGGGAVLAVIDPASLHGRDSSSGPHPPVAPENTTRRRSWTCASPFTWQLDHELQGDTEHPLSLSGAMTKENLAVSPVPPKDWGLTSNVYRPGLRGIARRSRSIFPVTVTCDPSRTGTTMGRPVSLVMVIDPLCGTSGAEKSMTTSTWFGRRTS